MTQVAFTNNFHKSVVTRKLQSATLTKRQVRSIRKSLCGIGGCTCGTALGTRGSQYHNDHQFYVQELPDGGVMLLDNANNYLF